VTPAIKQEIDDLLKAMKNESAYLKARQPLLDANIKAEEDELKEIRRIQTDAEGVVRKANKTRVMGASTPTPPGTSRT
jgi:hypothetical protein